MDEYELLEQYFWILENCHDPDVVFSELPVERNFANLWVYKLCNDIYRGIDAKRLRNRYLMELSKCMDQRELRKNFMQPPPKGALPPFEDPSNIEIDHQLILHDMQVAAAECVPLTSPRHYETHMSTKIFDNNRGACAYLAVSLGDPKDGPIWKQMGSNKTFEQNTGVNAPFGAFCLEAIANELAGHARPGECQNLEEQLHKYEVFIKNYEIGEKAATLHGNELRNFLLVNFQTDLIQALNNCQ